MRITVAIGSREDELAKRADAPKGKLKGLISGCAGVADFTVLF